MFSENKCRAKLTLRYRPHEAARDADADAYADADADAGGDTGHGDVSELERKELHDTRAA